MRAVTYRADGTVHLAEVEEPTLIEPDDAIVRVTATAICGSDLHLLHGRVPGMREGSVLGHEAVGVIDQLGAAVGGSLQIGDRVVVSFSIACGRCWFCARMEHNQCEDARALGYGEFLGDLDGAQAEAVRVPHAGVNLHLIPQGVSDEAAVFAGDILATGVYICARSGVEAGKSVAIVGAGPVGMMALLAAKGRGAAPIWVIDRDPSRLDIADSLGGAPIDLGERDPVVSVQKATGERGADIVLECVGMEETFAMSLDLVRPNGTVGVIGVHTDLETAFPLGEAWRRGISIVMGGTCDVQTHWDEALELIASGAVDPTAIISDRLPLTDAVDAYRRFEAREAMKIVLIP